MKEILKQILESEQVSFTCVLLPDGQWLWGRLQSVTDELLVFENAPNKNTGRYWTTIVRIDAIQALDFRCDTRPLTEEEKESQGIPIEE